MKPVKTTAEIFTFGLFCLLAGFLAYQPLSDPILFKFTNHPLSVCQFWLLEIILASILHYFGTIGVVWMGVLLSVCTFIVLWDLIRSQSIFFMAVLPICFVLRMMPVTFCGRPPKY